MRDWRDGSVLVERRPEAELLGGMMGPPRGLWGAAPLTRPFAADWHDLGVEVRHTFTHFHPRPRLMGALARRDAPGDFRSRVGLAETMLTVMRKALTLGLDAMEG